MVKKSLVSRAKLNDRWSQKWFIFAFLRSLTSICQNVEIRQGRQNVEILHTQNISISPKNFRFFLRKSLESLLDFKTADIQSIQPTFVCIWVLHSDPLRYLLTNSEFGTTNSKGESGMGPLILRIWDH